MNPSSAAVRGVMIAFLLAAVLALGLTGTVALGGALNQGPFAVMTRFSVS